MSRPYSLLALIIAVGFPAVGGAQDRTADVLSPGEIRLSGGGEYIGFSTLFEPGGEVPLGGNIGGPLTPADLPTLESLGMSIEAFLAATDPVAFAIEPGDLIAGDLSVEFGWNTRVVPGRIGIGVLPRLEIGFGGSVYRNERLTRRVDLVGGTLGLNPDVPGNAALLTAVDPTGAAVGNAMILPVEGTRLGAELQDRVFAVTEDSLSLPESPLSGVELEAAFGLDPFPGAISEWRAGDVEIDARVEVFRTFDPGHYPTRATGLNLRAIVTGALRIGTGQMGSENPRLDWGPQVGFGGTRFGAAADLFSGRYFWVSGGGSYMWLGASTVGIATSTEPIPGEETIVVQARRDPGNEWDLWLIPRLRLTDELSLGASLQTEHRGEGVDDLAGVTIPIPSRSRNSVGVVFRYTNLPAYDEGRSNLPIEAAVGFNSAVSGSGAAPAGRTAFVTVALLPRLWGERPGVQ